MAGLAIYLLLALNLALVIRSQQTFPPVIPTFPPPPTMTSVIYEILILFVGEPIIVGEDVRLTIDCSPLIDQAIANGISNPTARWFKDGVELSNGFTPNIEISADTRRCIINVTPRPALGQLMDDSHYTCEVNNIGMDKTFVCDQTNEGNEFFVGFFRNRFGLTDEPEVIPPVLWITTKESTPVNFNVSTIFGHLASGVATPGEITYVYIPLGFIVFDSSEDTDEDTRFKGIRIKAEDDRRVVVFGQHEEVASNDAYLGLPVISLPAGRSYEYIAASILGDSGTVSQAKDSIALIIGTENDTEIILEPSTSISHPFAPALTGNQFIPGSSVQFRTVTIQRFQTFYLQVRGGDISGTRIIANKPISVFSGHENANIPLANESGDILIEQLQPIDTWGTEAVTVPLRTRSGDVLKVFASQDSTTVNVTYTDINSGMVTSDSFSFTLNRNGFRELGGDSLNATGAIADFALIQSNNPIAVFQFSRSFTTDNNIMSDPFMLSVPSCEQYRNSYVVITAPFNEIIEGTVTGRVAYVNYTNIAVPAEYFNASLITVNNNTINASEFRPIRRADDSIWGYGAQLLLDEGAQVIRHQDPNAALSVTLYGFSNQQSWGCIGGTGLDPVALSVVSFESTGGSGVSIQVSESAGPLVVVLVLSEAVGEQVSVFVIATPMTARAGGDFGPSQNYTVTFPAGSTRQSVNIPIVNDTMFELDESFQLELSVPEAAVRAGIIDGCDPITARRTVEITDDDPFTVMFEQRTYSVNENAGPAQPVLVLSNPSSMEFTVQVTDTNGTAMGGGVDYISGPYTVTFPAGTTRVLFDITINDDGMYEGHGDENFMLTIDPTSLPTGGSVGTPGSAEVTIIDDDPFTVMFEQPTYSVDEDAGPVQPVLVFSNPSSMNITVQVTNIDGSATGGGVDYISGPYTVTFPAGVTSVPFDIPINDDGILEGSETFMLTIDPNSLPPTGVTVGSPDQAIVTIVDDDGITVSFEQQTYSVDENAGPARPVLVLSNPSSMEFSVTVFNTDGSAIGGGVDYISGPYTVTFPAGTTRVPFDIPIIDDDILEINENFRLTINPSSLPTGVTTGNPDQATVTIVDDDHISSPTNVRATVLTPCSVEVTWDASPDVTGYIISYITTTTSYASNASVMVNGGSTTRHTLSNLEESTPYSITVQSFTSDEISAQSTVVSVTTYTDVPSSPPQNVMVTSVNPASLMVSWQPPPPIDHNGPITYMIQYTRVGSSVNVNSGTTQYTISGLVAYVDYSVIVAAMNVNGTGPFSNPPVVGRSGEDAPSEPLSLQIVSITPSSVTLQWSPPVPPNGIITQYSIQFNETATNNFGNNMLNILMGTVEGLSPDTVYVLRLTAHTSVGEGPPSNITVITPPGPVSDVTVRNESVTSSTLTLTWMEISLTNSNFSHYTVFYLPVRDPYGPIMASNRRKRQSAQAGELTMNFCGTTGTLTNLYGAVTYRIQVAAVVILNGQVVTGDRSTAIEVTTLENVPTAPQNLNLMDFTNTGATLSVTLTWSRPDPPNGLITQYNVSYVATNIQNEGFNDNFIIQPVDSSSSSSINLSYTWTGLSQGEYQFSVVAFTSTGAGETARLMLPRLPIGASCDGSSDDNNGVIIALATIATIAVIGLVISVVINVFFVVQRKQSRYDVNQSIIRYSDVKQSVSRDKTITDSTNKYIKPSEPEHEVIDIKPNVKPDCDVKMDADPASSN